MNEIKVLISLIVVILMLTCCAGDHKVLVDDSTQGATSTRLGDGMTMVYVPAGQFEMGTSDTQLDTAMQACLEISDETFILDKFLSSPLSEGSGVDEHYNCNKLYIENSPQKIFSNFPRGRGGNNNNILQTKLGEKI